jgi:hypothetical protein
VSSLPIVELEELVQIRLELIQALVEVRRKATTVLSESREAGALDAVVPKNDLREVGDLALSEVRYRKRTNFTLLISCVALNILIQ